MRTKKSIIIASSLLCLAVTAPSCKKPGVMSEGGPVASASPKGSARWVAQYRPAGSAQAGAYAALYSLNALSIVSPSIVFVAADYPAPAKAGSAQALVVKTLDGGKTWTELPIPLPGMNSPSLNSISFVDPNVGWAVGVDQDTGKSFVVSTSDGGSTWSVAALDAKMKATSVHVDKEGAIWIVGIAPKPGEDEDSEGGPTDILISTDQGKTFTPSYRVPVSINSMDFLDSKTGWTAGVPASVYHTSDGGRLWDAQITGVERGVTISQGGAAIHKDVGLNGVSFCDPLHGWAVGSAPVSPPSVLLSTSDGGKTWKNLWLTDTEEFSDVHFISPKEGWIICSKGGYVYHSSDSGNSWQVEPVILNVQVPLFRIGAADASHVWAVGGGAIFFREFE
jgi:photosystem II stability/assembly factor-like uncharacterized protein